MSGAIRLAVLAALFATGCATEGGQPSEYLDKQTGVTVRASEAPLIYAHEVPEIAANVRDYLSVGAVEVINMSNRRYYLVCVSWSTVDRARAGIGPAPIPDRLVWSVPGMTREYTPVSHDARSLGVSEPQFRPPSGYVGESWYEVPTADLRSFAAAAPGSIALRSDAGSVNYVTWDAAIEPLRVFVRDLPESQTGASRH